MEVAGLVFGVFPVVCQLLQQYEQGAQFVSNYKHFRTEYKRFILDVRYQQRELQELLYTLMCSGPEAYITDITRKEFLAMVSKEEFKGWKDPQLFKLWEKRLDEDYQFVAEGLNDVFGTFSELEKRLEIQEVRRISRSFLVTQIFTRYSFVSSCTQNHKQLRSGSTTGSVPDRLGSELKTEKSVRKWEHALSK